MKGAPTNGVLSWLSAFWVDVPRPSDGREQSHGRGAGRVVGAKCVRVKDHVGAKIDDPGGDCLDQCVTGVAPKYRAPVIKERA